MKEKIYFVYRNMENGEYNHPTITIKFKTDYGKIPRWMDHDIITITSQTEGEHKFPYAINIKIPLSYYTEKAANIVKGLMVCNGYRDILRVLKKRKIERYVRHDDNYVPYKFRNKADLWLKAMENGLELKKAI